MILLSVLAIIKRGGKILRIRFTWSEASKDVDTFSMNNYDRSTPRSDKMKTKDSEEIVSYMDVTLPYVVDECFYVNEECWKEWQAVGADHVFDRIVQPLRGCRNLRFAGMSSTQSFVEIPQLAATSTPSDRSKDREFLSLSS